MSTGDADAPLSAINSEIERFVSALRRVLSQQTEGVAASSQPAFAKTPTGRVILQEGQLRQLKVADAALLVLFGYRQLMGQNTVRATALSTSLRECGFHAVRGVALKLGRHEGMVRADGERRARTYSLTDDGMKYCEELISRK